MLLQVYAMLSNMVIRFLFAVMDDAVVTHMSSFGVTAFARTGRYTCLYT